MYDRSQIEEIKERLDIVDVIGRYVTLKKTGTRYRGLCPFHQEKTPSFIVYPDRGSWHCYGACSTGGDVISFIQKKENMEFGDAVRMLAAMAGVELRRVGESQTSSLLHRLRHIHELATAYYHDQLLRSPQAKAARDYVARRGLSAKTVADFQIGYAPDGWDQLLRYLQEREFTLDDLEQAGLVVRKEGGGAYDRFRNRIMIPIRDARGRVVGFGGRVLDDGVPKYMNSPQTPLFDKSRVIFALDRAKRAIRAKDQVVLVEGYMDVISAHQHGFENVVAAMGTAVTEYQLQTLTKHAKNLIFALDADAAGINATIRSLHLAREALSAGLQPVPTPRGTMRYEKQLSAALKVALLPAGKDPDDIIRHDAAAWLHLIDQALPLVDFFFRHYAADLDMQSAQGKKLFVQRMLPLIAEISDPIERQHYVSKLAVAVGVTEQDIDFQLEQLRQQRSRLTRPSRTAPTAEPPPAPLMEPPPDEWSDEEAPAEKMPLPAAREADPLSQLEEQILIYILHFPHLLAWADGELAELSFFPLSSDDFHDAIYRSVFDAKQNFLYSVDAEQQRSIREALDATIVPVFDTLLAKGNTLANLREEQLQKDIVDLILRLRMQRTRQAITELNLVLRDAADDGDEKQAITLQIQSHVNLLQKLTQAIASRSFTERWRRGKRY